MKKIMVVALAILLAMSTMPLTAFAASEPAKFDFAGFDVKKDAEGKGVVVDLENNLVYGLSALLKVSDLGDYLEKGADVDSMYLCKNYGTADQKTLSDDDYIGTGTYIVLKDEGVEYPFEIVVFGDVNGDSAVDALDAFYIAKVASNLETAPTDVATNMAATSPETYENGITAETYQSVVNSVVMKDEDVDQNKGVNANTVESIVIEDQIYTGEEITVEDDVEILFNDALLSDAHYEIVGYERNIDLTTGKEKATVTLKGKGLFAGEIVVEFEIVGLIQSIVNEVNKVITEANLNNVVEVVYTNNEDVDGVDIVINASNAIRGNFDANMAAFNGLLAKIDEYRAEKLQGVNLTVGDFALASNGSFSRGDVKNFVFDLASGIFCELAYAKSNTIKSYSGAISTTDDNAEAFNVNLIVKEDVAGDINRVKNFSAKIARYVSFDVVDGNAVINVAMPAAFSAKVVDILSNGTGSIEDAKATFDGMQVYDAIEYLAKVSPSDISAGSVEEIEQALSVAAMLVDFVNKGLGEVADASVYDVNGKYYPLLNGKSFVYDEANTNKFGALVIAAGDLLTDEVLDAYVGDFNNNGIYTVKADVELDYKGIKETIIVNLDLFTAVEETPDVIEETAKYFGSIINTLGISNVASVSYDKVALKALVTMNATELLAGKLAFNDAALDGLYSDIKGYFDDNYGTSTIVVDGNEIVKAGAINKSALKAYLFDMVGGFFADVAAMDSANIVVSSDVKVVEANGTTHNFDLDFKLVGDDADVAKIKSISGKVANYVSLDTTSGNAAVSVVMPAGMTEKIISTLGSGSVAEAKAKLNALTVADLLEDFVAKVEPSDISASNAAEIQTIIDMVAGMDAVVNKLLGKVSSATAYNTKGESMALLSGDAFVVKQASILGLVDAFGTALSDAVLDSYVADFVNTDGTYTLVADVATTIGGIKETVIINIDIFGDFEDAVEPEIPEETKTAVEKTVEYVGSIFEDLGISNAASVAYADGKAVASLDATAILNNGLQFNDEALDGLYSELKGYFDETFGDSTITIGGYEIVKDGAIVKSSVKDFVFDFATGFFSDVANMNGETLRSFNTVVVDAEGNIEDFVFDFALAGDPADLATIKSVAGKVAAHVTFTEVNGNAVVSATMPAGVTDKIIATLGEGEGAAKAQENLNKLSVAGLLEDFVAKVEPSDISASNAAEVQTIIDLVADMDSLINKVLGKVSSAEIKMADGSVLPLLSGDAFVVENATVLGLVDAFGSVLNDRVLDTAIANFMNEDGTYTFACDVALSVGGIKETVIFNLDIFGDIEEEKKDAAEETVDYVEDIIADLGISNVASVTYADGKAVASFNASEILAGKLSFKEEALDGLYTEIKDYFDANFGDSTITVGDYVLVKDGAIDKSAVKDFVFDFAAGFFTDLANMDDDVFKTLNAVVVDANGEAESFGFDFVVSGSPEDMETIQSIAGKVADHVSFTEVNGNAVATVKMPSAMTDKIISTLGDGQGAAKAQENLNALSVAELLDEFVSKISPEDISASNAAEVQTIIDVVAGMDAVINKLLGKVSTATAYDVNGNALPLLNGSDFVVDEASVYGLVDAFGSVLSTEVINSNMGRFMTTDGSYSIVVDAGLSVGGIRETVVINFDIF